MFKVLNHLCLGVLWLACTSVQAGTCQNNIPASNPDGAYTVHGDGTVTDTRTGLVWKQCKEGQSGTDCATGSAQSMTWTKALEHAKGHSFAGHADWRLPSVKELRSLVEECRISPAINDSIFQNDLPSSVWTGSPDATSANLAWRVSFGGGEAVNGYRNGTYQVRLVRGEQSLAPSPASITASAPAVAPAPSAQPNTFVFTVNLSRPLTTGESVALNFDDQNGVWYAESQPAGRVPMACSASTCTLEHRLEGTVSRNVRALVFDSGNQQIAESAGAALVFNQASITADELMDWLQTFLPTLFPDALATVSGNGFVFRGPYANGNFIGVADDGMVYVMGPAWGGQLVPAGTLGALTCTVKPANCNR